MREVTVHCIYCKRMNAVPVARLTHSFSVRCDHCSALRSLTEREKALLLDGPRLVQVDASVDRSPSVMQSGTRPTLMTIKAR